MSKLTDRTPIGTWPSVSRAYEIALLGDFTLSVVFDPLYTNGFEDYELIRAYFTDVEFVANGDICVEMRQPDYITPGKVTHAVLGDIYQRVINARNNPRPTEFTNDGCDALLRTAITRLGMSVNEQNKTVRVSTVIAQLDGADKVEPHHIAEAIHYRTSMHSDDAVCNAERRDISFGKGIHVSLHSLDLHDVAAAVNYLQSLYPNHFND